RGPRSLHAPSPWQALPHWAGRLRLHPRPFATPLTAGKGDKDGDSDYLIIKTDKKYVKLNYNDILFIEGLKDYVESLISSGVAMILAGSSRPCSGSEHLFSHYLELYAIREGLPLGRHGEQVAVGERLMAIYHMRHNQENWWREKRYQPEEVLHFLKKVKCPHTISQIKISEEVAVEALINAPLIRPERYTILHKKPIKSRNEAIELINKVCGAGSGI
ncbi:MAG: iron-containing alcohol dehydrogenase, partial [Candidatus Bathyarchaeia archaeon]